jgi:hypothetical protein
MLLLFVSFSANIVIKIAIGQDFMQSNLQLTTYDQIVPEFLIQFRKSRKESQTTFWAALGVPVTTGCSYEIGRSQIPTETKRLLFLHYGLGIPTDCQSEEFQRFVELLTNGKTLAISKVIGLLSQANTLLAEAP